MAERPVPGIMEKSGQAKKFIQIGKGGEVRFESLVERGIKLFRESPCDVHGSEGVLKTSMFGRRKNPPRTLQLEDASEALNPGGIDHIPFRSFPFYPVGHHHVVIDGVRDQSSALNPRRLFMTLRPSIRRHRWKVRFPFPLLQDV